MQKLCSKTWRMHDGLAVLPTSSPYALRLLLFLLQHSEDGNGRRMPHKYILLDYGAGESGAVFIGSVEVLEGDGKFLA